jgi:hypothetical protein
MGMCVDISSADLIAAGLDCASGLSRRVSFNEGEGGQNGHSHAYSHNRWRFVCHSSRRAYHASEKEGRLKLLQQKDEFPPK